MPNSYANITDKKLVGENGVKLLYKTTLALLETAVEAIEDELSAKATRLTFNATIPTSGWTLSGGLYSVSVSVQGILASDQAGGIGPVQTGTEATDKAIRAGWNKVVRISAAADAITVYASAAPTTAIPILLEVFR